MRVGLAIKCFPVKINEYFFILVLLSGGQTNYGSMAFHWTTLTSSYDMNQNNSQKSQPSFHRYYNSYQEDQYQQSHQQQQEHQGHRKQQHHFLPQLPDITEKTVVSEFSKKWNHCRLTPPTLSSLVDLSRRGSGVNSVNFYRSAPAPPNTALEFSKRSENRV